MTNRLMELLSLHGAWKDYLNDCVPIDAGAPQVVGTQFAFYAGAIAIMTMVKGIGDNEEINEEKGIEILEHLQSQINEFMEAVKHMKSGPAEEVLKVLNQIDYSK